MLEQGRTDQSPALPRAAWRRVGRLGRGDGAPRRRQRARLHDAARRHRPRERRARPPEPGLRRRSARHGPGRHRRRLPARQRRRWDGCWASASPSCWSAASPTWSRRQSSSRGTARRWPGSRASLQAEVELLRDDGRPTYALLNATPVRDALRRAAALRLPGARHDRAPRGPGAPGGERVEARRGPADRAAGLWEWTLSSDRVSWSDELCRIHGLRGRRGARELISSRSSTCIPTTAPASGASWRRRWPSGGRGASTTASPAPTARSAWCTRAARSSSTRTTPRPAVAVHGTCQDVTEGRRVEDALRAAEQLFRRAFDDAPIGMALIDLEGRWLRLNRAICRMLGRTEHDLRADTPRPCSSSRGPRPRRAARARAAHRPPPVLRRRAALHARRRARHPRAGPRVAHARRRRAPAVLPLPARRRVRPAARGGRAPRGRGASAGDHRQLADAISVKDLEKRYLLVNRRWEELYGISAEQALGRTGREVGAPDADTRNDELDDEVAAAASASRR